MPGTGESIPQNLPQIGRRTLLVIAAVAVTAFGGLLLLGLWIRHTRVHQREEMAKQIRDQPPVVNVVHPKSTDRSVQLTLPAEVRAFATTALFARTNGFLAQWRVDINDRVKKGELMAVIAAPDTDAELEQAVATLRQQRVNYELAIATEARYRGLIPIHGVTQEQLDQVQASREQGQANVAAAAAAVDRLQALVGFEKIVAPYDGVVTARTYDVGALISASNIAPGQELYDVAADDRLRVFVNVPQAYSLLIRFDQPVQLSLERNFPGRKFTGFLARSSSSLDPVTRTLRTELDFKNDEADHHILPGMYGEAIFTLHRAAPMLTIPTSALLFEADGRQVAVVGPDNKIHFQPIVPGNDFGTEIEVISGLKGNERIVANPGEKLAEGLPVSPQSGGDAGGPSPAPGGKG